MEQQDEGRNSANSSKEEAIETEIQQQSSILGIMVDKCDDIKQSISLIKKEIDEQSVSHNDITEAPKQSPSEFNGLVNLLSDSKVSSMIKTVAGEDTQQIISKALNEVGSGRDRKEVLSESLQKLKSNLGKVDKVSVLDDPALKLALNLVGLTKKNLI